MIDFQLNGRRALVTGAGAGIGAATAKALAEAGATVAVNDIVPARAQHIATSIHGGGHAGFAIPADIADPEDVRRMFEAAIAHMGGLDILVCNAGITAPKTVFETSPELWDRVLRTNLTGGFLCARQALEHMRAQATGGRIVFVGSVVGHQGALMGHAAYAASKAGVHGLAKTLARTAAPLGVTVNVVAPGVTDTEMLHGAHDDAELAMIAKAIPLGIADVEDTAAAIVYLASAAGRHLTGATIDVNGGMLMR